MVTWLEVNIGQVNGIKIKDIDNFVPLLSHNYEVFMLIAHYSCLLYWLTPNKRQAIIGINADQENWHDLA